MSTATWPAALQGLETRLRPFVARRVAPADVDDVMQDVYLRMQRGLGALRATWNSHAPRRSSS